MSIPTCPDHNRAMIASDVLDHYFCPDEHCPNLVRFSDHVDQPSDKPRVRISGGPDGSQIEIRNDDGSMFPPIVSKATVHMAADKVTLVDLTLTTDELDIEAQLSKATEDAILALAQRIRMRRGPDTENFEERVKA